MSVRIAAVWGVFSLLLVGLPVPTQAGQVVVTVSGQAGPWSFVSGGLNANDAYGTGDEGSPTVVSAQDGIAFTAGATIQVQYLSGLVTPGGGYAYVDANGETSDAPANNTNYGSFGVMPSYYMSSSTYPIYIEELVGTFATSTGAIVGTPFKIGDSATLIVPTGATQLQMGVNDAGYFNNGGSLSIKVSGQSVPEPSSLVLACIAGGGLMIAAAWRRRRRAA